MPIHELFPYIHVRDAAAAIAFYRDAFGAEEEFRLTEPGGRIGHAEMRFGGMVLMISEEFPEYGIQAPPRVGGTSVTLHIHVDDADATIAKAEAAGATVANPAQDWFHGERSGCIIDPFGHRWNIGHSIEEVTPDEMQRRYTAMMTG
jgi:uncharacterized glyoxalase superfamily protein PhnB